MCPHSPLALPIISPSSDLTSEPPTSRRTRRLNLDTFGHSRERMFKYRNNAPRNTQLCLSKVEPCWRSRNSYQDNAHPAIGGFVLRRQSRFFYPFNLPPRYVFCGPLPDPKKAMSYNAAAAAHNTTHNAPHQPDFSPYEEEEFVNSVDRVLLQRTSLR